MTTQCHDIDAYLDDSLAGPDRDRYERHLLTCTTCQEALEDVMQLAAAGAELARRADRPIPQQPKAPISWGRWLAPAAAAAGAVVVILWPREPSVDRQIAEVLLSERSTVPRLPYAPLDRYRPYGVVRGEQKAEAIPNAMLGKLPDRSAAAIAVQLSMHEFKRAEDMLASAGHSDELEIERAVVASANHHPEKALSFLDGVLARAPGNTVALWNRAVVLSDLQLPLATAEAFDQVAQRGEVGWSGEALQNLGFHGWAAAEREKRWRAAKHACNKLDPDALPDRETVRSYAPICRPAFYEAVRRARREQLPALQSVAETLDETAHNTAATQLLRDVAAIDPAVRQRAVAAYVALTGPAAPTDKPRLLEQLRAARQPDLLLGAISRSGRLGTPAIAEEYIALALATRDPYFAELAAERRADLLRDRGDLLGAEVVLRRAVHECSTSEVELRCSELHLALAHVYETMHRPSEIRDYAQKGLERSRRHDLYWSEGLFFDYLAEAARYDGEAALMRVYLREATLRIHDECRQTRLYQETVAMASIETLEYARARRALSQSNTCNELPTLGGARVIAELARIDGTGEEAKALRNALVEIRKQPDRTPGELAYADAIEGRLLAATDATAARPVLRRAIAAADRAGNSDADGAKARGDAYGSLLVLSAAEPDHAATLALIAEAVGVPLRPGCAVGAMVDGERVLVVARDPGGSVVQHFAAGGRTSPGVDAEALVPAAIAKALASCERVDVLALPPVFGLPRLLPPSLAWSYRGRAQAAAPPPAAAPVVVTVADAVPPAELDLPPLRATSLPPIPHAVHRELVGFRATPEAVVGELGRADVVEIHAHGYVDRGVSDASLIALSPQADGRFSLVAREIAGLQLPRAPLVILAACHAGYTAPYRHEPWGLPRAFLLAGARAVIASPDAIPDREAGAFFRAVEQRILGGIDPAIALRDERALRLATDANSWTGKVLLFD